METAKNTEESNEKRITLADLASHYGVSIWTIHKWLRQGMPHERLGVRTVRVQLGLVRAWLLAREGGAA